VEGDIAPAQSVSWEISSDAVKAVVNEVDG